MNEERHGLYQLIMSQLTKDGYTRAAELLSDTALIPRQDGGTVLRGDEPDLEGEQILIEVVSGSLLWAIDVL